MATPDTKSAAKRMSAIAAGVVALISSISGGVYFLEDHYLTDRTGVLRDELDDVVTHEQLQVVQQQTFDYLLDLRIEQAEQRMYSIENRRPSGELTERERRELIRIEDELKRLKDKREGVR